MNHFFSWPQRLCVSARDMIFLSPRNCTIRVAIDKRCLSLPPDRGCQASASTASLRALRDPRGEIPGFRPLPPGGRARGERPYDAHFVMDRRGAWDPRNPEGPVPIATFALVGLTAEGV
jgi:hypothetical protein